MLERRRRRRPRELFTVQPCRGPCRLRFRVVCSRIDLGEVVCASGTHRRRNRLCELTPGSRALSDFGLNAVQDVVIVPAGAGGCADLFRRLLPGKAHQTVIPSLARLNAALSQLGIERAREPRARCGPRAAPAVRAEGRRRVHGHGPLSHQSAVLFALFAQSACEVPTELVEVFDRHGLPPVTGQSLPA